MLNSAYCLERVLKSAKYRKTVYFLTLCLVTPCIYTLQYAESYELVILTKSQRNWGKIVDFLIIAYLGATCQFWLRIL